MRRRDLLRHTLAAAVLQDSLVGRLTDPSLAGKSRARVTDYENDPFVVGVEGQLRCTCGCNLSVYTCRTTDFTCETSPALHQQVIALVEEGKTADEILSAFMAQYGETVLMAPPMRGFNLAAYVVPGLAILTAAALLARHLTRQAQVRGSGRGPDAPGPGRRPPTADSASHAKLAAELEKLEL